MEMNPFVIVVLGLLVVLSVMFLIMLIIILSSRVFSDRKKKEFYSVPSAEALPLESMTAGKENDHALVAVIPAAVMAYCGEEKSSSIRVASFRRVGKHYPKSRL